MNEKHYRIAKLLIVMALGASIGIAVSLGAWPVPLIAVILAAALILFFDRKRKVVRHDERDLKIAGNASRMTYSVYGIAASVLGATLIALGERTIGLTLAYSVCVLLLLQGFFFRYYNRGEQA